MISINNLTFNYYKNSEKVINDISYSIESGKVYVLLGLNGCGKTTLIKLLAGLLEPSTGTIMYDNQSIKNIPIKDRSKLFSYVSQKSICNDDFYVKDYLTYGVVSTLKFYETPKKNHLLLVENVATRLGIFHLLDKKIGQLSGGEKQIVSIASAIIQDTPVILLDEPTSALDLKNQNIVLSLLNEIAKDGKTIILSSHNPNHALFLNADVILMNHGKIEMSGTSFDVITIDSLKSVYGESLCFSEELPYKEISFKN